MSLPDSMRPRGTPKQDQAPEAPIVRSVLDALFEAHRKDLIEASVASTQKLLVACDEIQKNKIAAIDQKILALQAQNQSQQQEIDQLCRAIAPNFNESADIRKQLVTAANIKADPNFDEQWDRNPDLSVLFIGTTDLVSKDSMSSAIQSWLDQLSLPEGPWQLLGPPMGRNFNLALDNNDHGVGILRATKASEPLRDKTTKEWENLYVRDPEDNQLPISISADKVPGPEGTNIVQTFTTFDCPSSSGAQRQNLHQPASAQSIHPAKSCCEDLGRLI